MSPRLTLGDSADVSALCQFEEEFLILDVADEFIENIDVLVQSVNEDRVIVGPLLAFQLITFVLDQPKWTISVTTAPCKLLAPRAYCAISSSERI